MTPIETATARYHAYVECLNARRYDALAHHVAPELYYDGRSVTFAQWLDDPIRRIVAVMPDLRWHVEQLIVADDRVAARLRNTGTPVVRWLGCEPIGRAVCFAEHAIYRFDRGRIVEARSLIDTAAVRDQLSPCPPSFEESSS